MKKTISVLSAVLVVSMFISSIAFAEEPDTSTTFSGNLRLGYRNMQDDADAADEAWAENEDDFSVHYLEIRAKKQVGPMGVYINERIGGASNRNYLYEGWVSYKAPGQIGSFKIGNVPQPFGIFANGLYYPKGIPFAAGWMWQYNYGVRYDNVIKAGEGLGVNVAAAYFDKGLAPDPTCACRDTISGRIGIDLAGDLAIKAGGSAQYASLKAVPVGDGALADDETKLGIAGDVSITPGMLPIPVTILGEFINYSLGEADAQKGNIMMGQLDVTPIAGKGMLDKAILSLHVSMNMPTDENMDKMTTMIAQLRLIMCKQFNVFAQVFGDKVGDADMSGKGLRVWFMYVF